MCVYGAGCAHVYMWPCVPVEARGWYRVSSFVCCPPYFQAGSLTEPQAYWLSRLASPRALRISLPLLLSTTTTGVYCHSYLYMGVGELNAGTHAFWKAAYPLDQPHSPWIIINNNNNNSSFSFFLLLFKQQRICFMTGIFATVTG